MTNFITEHQKEDPIEKKKRKLKHGKKLMKYFVLIFNPIIIFGGGFLYFYAWQNGADPISVIISALFVLGGTILIINLICWIALKNAERFYEYQNPESVEHQS